LLLELNKADPLFESKCSFWRRDLSVPYRRIRVCVGDNENSKIMLAFLRIAEAVKPSLAIPHHTTTTTTTSTSDTNTTVYH
jgi:hypothetical protein